MTPNKRFQLTRHGVTLQREALGAQLKRLHVRRGIIGGRSMKRDMDVVRHILLKVEELTPGSVQEAQLVTDDWDSDVISYHAALMIEAGLLEGAPIRSMGSHIARVIISGLTWDGHDFLDAIRDDTIWRNTKSKVLEMAGTVSLEVLKAVAVSISRAALGLPPA